VDIDAGVLDVQIKDDDGYDLGGQVYFWGKGDPAKQYLMDGVDVGLTSVTQADTQELFTSVASLKNMKLDASTGTSSSELWADFTDVSSVGFSIALPEGASFVSALSASKWDIVESTGNGVYSFSAMWSGGSNTQTADTLQLGHYTFDTPDLGADVQFSLLEASAGNDAGESKSNASAIDMTIGYESQTAVSAASQDANGSYTMSSLSEGYYEVTMDKDFDLFTLTDTGYQDWSQEVRALTASDARAAFLIGLGGEASAEAIIAADVNKSGGVTSSDAREILLMSVKDTGKLESNLDWVFIDESADLSGVGRRSVKEGVDWEQGSSLLLDDDAAHENLVAILMGDVNASYKPEDDVILFA